MTWSRARGACGNRPGHGSASTPFGSAGLVLVPALAVDRRGVRMGRGGGSYDRVLARLAAPGRRPLVVALLHDGEIVDEVPAEPHDRAVDAALTPGSGFTRFPDSFLNPKAEWTK